MPSAKKRVGMSRDGNVDTLLQVPDASWYDAVGLNHPRVKGSASRSIRNPFGCYQDNSHIDDAVSTFTYAGNMLPKKTSLPPPGTMGPLLPDASGARSTGHGRSKSESRLRGFAKIPYFDTLPSIPR